MTNNKFFLCVFAWKIGAMEFTQIGTYWKRASSFEQTNQLYHSHKRPENFKLSAFSDNYFHLMWHLSCCSCWWDGGCGSLTTKKTSNTRNIVANYTVRFELGLVYSQLNFVNKCLLKRSEKSNGCEVRVCSISICLLRLARVCARIYTNYRLSNINTTLFTLSFRMPDFCFFFTTIIVLESKHTFRLNF